MYITGFLIIIMQCSCIGMYWSRKLIGPQRQLPFL